MYCGRYSPYEVHVRFLVHHWALKATSSALSCSHYAKLSWMMVLTMSKMWQFKLNTELAQYSLKTFLNSIFIKFHLFRTFSVFNYTLTVSTISIQTRRVDWTSEKVEQSQCNWLVNRFSQCSIYFQPKLFFDENLFKAWLKI